MCIVRKKHLARAKKYHTTRFLSGEDKKRRPHFTVRLPHPDRLSLRYDEKFSAIDFFGVGESALEYVYSVIIYIIGEVLHECHKVFGTVFFYSADGILHIVGVMQDEYHFCIHCAHIIRYWHQC